MEELIKKTREELGKAAQTLKRQNKIELEKGKYKYLVSEYRMYLNFSQRLVYCQTT